MDLKSFIGGIHPPHAKKMTEKKEIIKAVEPTVVKIPLSQHIGAPCKPIVNKGDAVKVGQKIGESVSFVSAPVHSSVSGTVKKVGVEDVLGGKQMCITIESDKENVIHESVVPKGSIDKLSKKEILDIIKEAGIVGMGGAGFPTHVKLSPPEDKIIDVLILNGAECEPYLTADHRLMLETPGRVIRGLQAIMKVLNVKNAYIGIEDNKKDAIKTMKNALKGDEGIEIVGLKTKYPQGAEKQLIYAVSKRQVPSGGLPMDAGAVVANVATSAAVCDAIETGMPSIERICTITGKGIKTPKNMLIKVGTDISEIINQCDGLTNDVEKLILGGPMMGMATDNLNIPATKTTSGLLAFNKKEAKIPEAGPCIKCGKCVDICPAFLQPVYISAHSQKRNYDKAKAFHALDCIECGSCSFVCPSKRPLLQSIRVAKKQILANRNK